MGTIQHHAIVVTGADFGTSTDLLQSRALAVAAGLNPSEITPPAVNGYQSFFIPPDGSNDGWGESAEGDAKRGRFRDALRHSDPRLYVRWIEVSYGELGTEITDTGEQD